MRWTGLLAALTLLPVPSRALDAPNPGADWHNAKNDRDLVVYFRDDKSADAREIRAFAEVNAPPWVVFNVVTDFENYPKFMPFTKEEKILQRMSPEQVLVYSVLTPPATAWRDSCSQITMTRGTPENGGVYRSEWLSHPEGAPTRPGVVRIRVNQGYWQMDPIDGGRRTHIVYEILTNPGGNLPKWLVDASATMGLPDLIRAVRKRATGKGD